MRQQVGELFRRQLGDMFRIDQRSARDEASAGFHECPL